MKPRYRYVVICINGAQEIRSAFPTIEQAEAFNQSCYGGDARIVREEEPIAAVLRPSKPITTRNNQNPKHEELAMMARLWH